MFITFEVTDEIEEPEALMESILDQSGRLTVIGLALDGVVRKVAL